MATGPAGLPGGRASQEAAETDIDAKLTPASAGLVCQSAQSSRWKQPQRQGHKRNKSVEHL